MNPTQSTTAAMTLLKRYRRFLIDRGRYEAVHIALQNGTVNSREVRAALAGYLKNQGLHDYWLGAVFYRSIFEWTGRYLTYSSAERNVHERTIKVWRLRPGAALDEYLTAPERPEWDSPRPMQEFYPDDAGDDF
jgi:hypothetical protein